ncbi:hypothetical protein GIB67_033838 [Kingdonia uniflora]|uniref:Uncharacterized protein n=1 Tax=Kingdonia uniflora TaxID=39325 RepID=A0A7J7LIA7_9MAGN|nr:hypothetical protein GIB67_033838 [Kingdonia uniflora]
MFVLCRVADLDLKREAIKRKRMFEARGDRFVANRDKGVISNSSKIIFGEEIKARSEMNGDLDYLSYNCRYYYYGVCTAKAA